MDVKAEKPTGAQGAIPFRGDNPPPGAQVYEGDNRYGADAPKRPDALKREKRPVKRDASLRIPQSI